MNAVVKSGSGSQIIEEVLIKGDLSKLTPEQRVRYYMEVCESVGLNPITKPFEYINLNGKLTLYALRACTDQLRAIRGVSVESLEESDREGVYIVTAKIKDKDGRTDMAKGAVALTGLKGEALANAMMKAETKSKRRATLSICGLGFLDETEVETIPGAKVMPEAMPAQTVIEAKPQETVKPTEKKAAAKVEPKQEQDLQPRDGDNFMSDRDFARTTFESVKTMIANATSEVDIDEALTANAKGLQTLKVVSIVNWNKLKDIATAKRAALQKPKPADDDFDDSGEIEA